MGALGELIEADAISLDVEAADWEEAVRAAGRLLEEAGIATEDYTQAMIDSVHKNGPYIVVAPGFAFAHARPSEAVKRTGMSWVRLAQPVEFGHKSNDPVTLVVALAAKDSSQHQEAMKALASLLADPAKRAAMDEASTNDDVLALLDDEDEDEDEPPAEDRPPAEDKPQRRRASGRTKDKILTVCGNGLGTSLFLKNTLEQVLDTWGWGRFINVEATDTVSARGKAKDADLIMTSGEIARALGDVGVPLHVIENFTSKKEIDAALRELYDV